MKWAEWERPGEKHLSEPIKVAQLENERDAALGKLAVGYRCARMCGSDSLLSFGCRADGGEQQCRRTLQDSRDLVRPADAPRRRGRSHFLSY